MLMPKRVKFRKAHRGRRKGYAKRGSSVAFGDFGLKSLEPAWITSRQIEACRVALSRKMKRDGRVWIRIFPDKPVSKKPLETRMGKGKGAPEFWVAVVKPGRILFEVSGVTREVANDALQLCSHKLPVKTKVVSRPDFEEAEDFEMKIHEIKEMKSEEIIQRIKDEEQSLVDLKFSHQLKQLTNTAKIKNVKRDIARLRTVLQERELQTAGTSVKGANA